MNVFLVFLKNKLQLPPHHQNKQIEDITVASENLWMP